MQLWRFGVEGLGRVGWIEALGLIGTTQDPVIESV